jgi:hypothetical protein
MRKLDLSDYIWDSQSRILRVRMPPVYADEPNIDASKRMIETGGVLITRAMRERLERSTAIGAKKQASEEAQKPENLSAAQDAARAAIAANLEGPLELALGEQVQVDVTFATDGVRDGERWDVSRSMKCLGSGNADPICNL